MPVSGNRQGLCTECGRSNNDHEFGRCLGESVDKKSKKTVQCTFVWSRCLTAAHSEAGRGSGPAERVGCLICPRHPNGKPRGLWAKPRTKPVTEPSKPKPKPEDDEVVGEKATKKKRAEAGAKTGNQDSHSEKKEKSIKSSEQKPSRGKNQKEQKDTKKEPSSSAISKNSAGKTPRIEAQESSGDELAWDQDEAEENALARQMQQLSLRSARDKRPDDPGTAEWKRVRAWCKDDELVYFRDPETGNKQRTVLTAWTEETKKFGKVKKECLVFYSRKDRRAFYCESFEDEEPRAGV
ncbi:hypothetical protein Trco_006055 [Trichoderma cornu-damae]|uniref:Uncharacterized protein n=1 Tax=Trichoderma cornu-damae TaxID=654480 RepID=A0A9P8QQS3_9HYPO|nr:hypothetical protein Trco_006055 [Trichoderma cornu-damae]